MFKISKKLVAIVVILATILAFFVIKNRTQTPAGQREYAQVTIGTNSKTFRVVLAVSPSEITQGLSDRETLGADGMLFILPARSQVPFWMYHMKFPLDFIWIADNKVVDLDLGVPGAGPEVPNDKVPTVAPRSVVTHVLEVPAGFINANQVKIGDPFVIQRTHEKASW